MATHSSILAWRISWTEEAGGLGCEWETKHTRSMDSKVYCIAHKTWMVCHCPLNLVYSATFSVLSPTIILHFSYTSTKPNYLIFPKCTVCFSDSMALLLLLQGPGMPSLFCCLLFCLVLGLFVFSWSFAILSLLQGPSGISPPGKVSCDLLLFWIPRVTLFLLNCPPYYYGHYILFQQREDVLQDGRVKRTWAMWSENLFKAPLFT